MKIYGWIADRQGCGYYRMGLPLSLIREAGHTVFATERMSPQFLNENEIDILVGQRVMNDHATIAWQGLAEQGNVRLVYEIDDNFFDIPEWNPAYREMRGTAWETNIKENIKVAHMVTVSTHNLANVVRPLNPNVIVIPNYIDNDLLSQEKQETVRVTLGWAGSATHFMDFNLITDALSKFILNDNSVGMHFIGETYRAFLPAIAGPRIRHTPWNPDTSEYYNSVDFDIGLAPLVNHPFNDSKSYIKALEYAALGIPVIASQEPPYNDFVKHGETGFLVRRPNQWGDYLRRLVGSDKLRREMSENARELASKYTIQEHYVEWEEAYAKLLAS